MRAWPARRGRCLLFFAVLDLVYGLSLWRPPPEALRAPSVRFVADVLPLPWWALLWALVGGVCLVSAWLPRHDRVAFAAAAGLKTLWGGVFLFGWIAAGLPRGWVAAVVWLVFAAFVVDQAGEPVRRTAS